MPWSAIPFNDKARIEALNETFEVEGIPHFVLLDGTGKVISKNARSRIDNDKEGKEFPWHPKALVSVEEGAADINDSSCFVYFNPSATDNDIAGLKGIAEEYVEAWKNMSEKPLLFMYDKSNSSMAQRVKSFTNVSAESTMMILNIPDGNKTVFSGSSLSTESIRGFIEGHLSGKLTPVGLKV